MAKKSAKAKRATKKVVRKTIKPTASAKRAPAESAAEQHVALLKGVYKRWGETKGGNVDEILDLLADDAVWRSIA
ncbi:MAG TPA: hypothetical protein VFR60_11785, partial [Sphingomicrobium sp.]|nr:hypothetical protein [Sphingomicrobium sp.]